jgi:hypothetical protein
MDLNKISKLTDEEIQLIVFLEKCTIGKWTINKKTGLVDIEGNFDCAKKKLKDFKGVRFGVVTGDFNCDDNKLTSLEGAPQEVGGHFRCWGKGNQISYETLELVWEAMQKNKIDYWTALSALKSRIESDDWKKMSIGLDDRLSKDAQKGYSILARFGHFV